ncbi:MAG: M55 family metallopeptidase [Thermaerobacter sp.]|nr:M55 family metallopeptidase [Thermaerobacter sp.]
MRVYISADMEGTAGVTGILQTMPAEKQYDAARSLMIAEVNAAIEGAFQGGATEVRVNDSHDGMRNLLLDALDPRAELVSGAPKPLSMVEGIEAGFDVMLCTGYHSMAGSAGTLAHTYNGLVHTSRLCGRPVGELGLNAAYAGLLGVPVGLVTGDDVLQKETAEIVPWAKFALVKWAASRYAARNLSHARACEEITKGAEAAVRGAKQMQVFTLPGRPEVEVTFLNAAQAGLAALCPGSERTSPLSVRFAHDDYREVFKAFRAMITLARD